jgi:hypothetical protein
MNIWPDEYIQTLGLKTQEEKDFPDDGYLSKNKPYLARLQRERRARKIRSDYQDVDPGAKAVIDSQRFNAVGGDASTILNSIVLEWTERNGLR